MKISSAALILILALSCNAVAENKGVCSSAPPHSTYKPPKKGPTAATGDNTGKITVTVLAAVSDTGYVCSAEVLRGVDKQTNDKALEKVRSWHFTPAKKDGHAVPVVMTLEVSFSRDKDGTLHPTTESSQVSKGNRSATQ